MGQYNQYKKRELNVTFIAVPMSEEEAEKKRMEFAKHLYDKYVVPRMMQKQKDDAACAEPSGEVV